MEILKHECGVAMVRLLRPLEYYKAKYGSWTYGLTKLYLLMEKQHNRGQEGAGIGVVKLHARPGHEYIYRERALGAGAIQQIFGNTLFPALEAAHLDSMTAEQIETEAPFLGEVMMGHLRYSTTGRSGIEYVHPFLRRNNWRGRNLLLCGNFNMTNVEALFQSVLERGQHPRIYSDTIVLLEQLGSALDDEHQRLYRQYRFAMPEPALTHTIEDHLDIPRVLGACAPSWDGGYVICGATGSGDMFALRDPNGIRPAFYYADDEIVILASERPVIQTVMNVSAESVTELQPGCALVVENNNRMQVCRVLPERPNQRCSFERIYFSRGSDADIYQERKALGRNLVPAILDALPDGTDNAVFSFIPNTAEVAFLGMTQGLNDYLDRIKVAKVLDLAKDGKLDADSVCHAIDHKIRIEKVAIKDIKLRTFISEGSTRNDLAAHVYDITYGTVRPGVDSLVVIDDSIVRGTTLRQSIIAILSRLKPRKIVIVSSAPQVRYPDCYGIDMSRLSEFIAFRAVVSLINERGMQTLLKHVYMRCVEELARPADQWPDNPVKELYAPFSDTEISDRIAEMLTDPAIDIPVQIIYQPLDGLHKAIPDCPGDWYFSGDYPTPGGVRVCLKTYINFYEGHADRRS